MQPLPAQALPAVNSGSSSLRIAIYQREPRLPLLLRDQVTGLGPAARCQAIDPRGQVLRDEWLAAADHRQTLKAVLDWTAREAAGHLVVHGGPRFHAPVPLAEEVIAELGSLEVLAPNHRGTSLQGIAALQRVRPGKV